MKSKSVWRKIALFYFIAYLFSGILFLAEGYLYDYLPENFFQFPMYGPMIAAFIMVISEKGSLKGFVKEKFSLKADKMCYLSLLIPVIVTSGIIYFSQTYLHVKGEGSIASVSVIILIIVHMLFDAAGEEAGWRGYMLPELQKIYSPLWSALILGLFWILWHVPQLMQGLIHVIIWAPAIMAISVILTVLYNRSGKSVIPVILMHCAINVIPQIFPVAGNQKVMIITSVFFVLWAFVLIVLNWSAINIKPEEQKVVGFSKIAE